MQPQPDGARHPWFSGVRVTVHVDAGQSQGRLGVWESGEWRGVRLPLHVHTREDEQVVVLEGEIRVRVGDATQRFTELGVPALPGTAAPPPPDDATRAAAVRRLGVEVVGPPLAFDAE
jgi:hypothetical protein